MAVDPALVGFDVVNTLQDTLLNYVMANRKMQQQDRQFNTQMQMERNRLDEDIRRFSLREDRLNRQEQEDLTFKKANRAMLEQELNRRNEQKAQIDFDQRKEDYDSRLLVQLGLIPDFDEATGLSRPKLSERRLPDFYQGLPSYGLSNLFLPTETDILMNARLQGLIQKGE